MDIRLSYTRFPKCTQAFWTWFTGKALPNQQPKLKISGGIQLLITFGLLSCMLWINFSVTSEIFPTYWYILPVTWMITVGTLRKLEAVICHHCVHNTVFKSRILNVTTVQVISTIILSKDYHAYFRDHCSLHHKYSIFCTKNDPDTKPLLTFGFIPGYSIKKLWWNLLLTILSPKFHLIFFIDRLKANFIHANSFYRIIMSGVYFLGIGIFLLTTHYSLLSFMLVVVIPLVPLFQICALLQFLSEHAWLSVESISEDRYHHEASWGRFCGDLIPTKNHTLFNKITAWFIWSVKFLFYHLPVRLTVLVGDLSHHDLHHRYPGSRDWIIAPYSRQQDSEKTTVPYKEIWGLLNALHVVFQRLENKGTNGVRYQNANPRKQE